MHKFIPFLLTLMLVSGASHQGLGQGLPPGWDFGATPSNHIISIPVTAEPNINGYHLNPGDYIGVFYENDDGDLACGGATEWLGDQNTGIIAFGDDGFTGEKDGFSSGETINYRFYSWSVEKEYEAEVICNDGLPVSCDVFISNGLSGVDSIWANGYYAVASATPDSVCAGSETQLLAEPSGGSGNYTYNWSSEPPGFSATIPDPVVIPSDSTTYFVAVQDGGDTLETGVLVEVFPAPEANTGPDITICEDSVVTVSASQNHSSSFFWSTAGDGTFNNISLLAPEYSPGPQDISNGDVQLSFTAEPMEPCLEPDISTMELSLMSLPAVEAGEDQTICEGQSTLVSATLLNAIEVLWSTSGDGTFDNPNQIETQYYPGTEDLATGQVVISVTAQALAPCVGETSDQFFIYFEYLPEVNAGNNQVICEDETVLLTGIATNSQGVLWETSGDGTFDDPANLETVYYPGELDIINGEADLTLSANAIEPCSGNVSDALVLTIIRQPVVDAGNDATICETGNLQLNGNVTNFDEVQWAADGDGTFGDNSSLNTIYYPGPEDIENQEIEISLTAQPLYPCTALATDQMNLLIIILPTANAGEDFTIPLGEDYLALGEATNYSSVLWTTQGDGFFEDPSEPETYYTPGQQDIDLAEVLLTFMANPVNPCVNAATDDLLLTIDTITFLNDPVSPENIKIYPNPTNGVLYIDFHNHKLDLNQIYVFDNRGNRIVSIDFVSENQTQKEVVEMNLSSYEPGIYIFQFSNGIQSWSEKVFLKSD